MKVKYLAHASFLFTTSDGTRIITDPYETGSFGGEVRYKPIKEGCDIVLISHEHADHNYTRDILGNPTIIRKVGESKVRGITFKGVASYHDETKGSQRGRNTIFVFRADGITFCHMGDLGELLSAQQLSQIGKPDVLFIPVGGIFTIDADGATHVMESLNPKLVIPMHYKTTSIGFPLASVDEFIKGKAGVNKLGSSEAEIVLPDKQEILVFAPALL
ncbi:MAG: MBL fold metallo-hydrolase [bacterium]|nr:MBL fold metallo-hydrolase [bacterium]